MHQQFERDYFQSIAGVIRLEFPSLRKSLAEVGTTVDYSRLRRALKCDFLAPTHLLENTVNGNQRFSKEQ